MVQTNRVAPRAGAWIETSRLLILTLTLIVAPRAGAWIETLKLGRRLHKLWSPLAQGRGLKLRFESVNNRIPLVAPRAGAWIETNSRPCILVYSWSPLAQGRGLKLEEVLNGDADSLSPLAQGRGLKLVSITGYTDRNGRPSRRGVD